MPRNSELELSLKIFKQCLEVGVFYKVHLEAFENTVTHKDRLWSFLKKKIRLHYWTAPPIGNVQILHFPFSLHWLPTCLLDVKSLELTQFGGYSFLTIKKGKGKSIYMHRLSWEKAGNSFNDFSVFMSIFLFSETIWTERKLVPWLKYWSYLQRHPCFLQPKDTV